MMAPERLRCFIERREDGWTAFCVDADLHANGRTADAARRALDGALERFCFECGEGRARVQRPAGWDRQLQYARAWLHTLAGRERLHYVFRWPPECVLGLA